jgi:hypothetical protein
MPLDPTSLVLVAVIKDPRDLEIARLLGWYRIPMRSAPKVIAVDYLALYQTGAFGEENRGIHYLAALRGHELTTRAELLRDEPHHPHANHEYYKLQLGPLERLPRPIRPDAWRRMTFLYTTGEYLQQAETLRDLVIRTDERALLWQTLRERAAASYRAESSPEAADLPGIDLHPEVLALLLGIKGGG